METKPPLEFDPSQPRYRFRNWEQFQHYKDRRPRWIKLHRSLLDDWHFLKMSYLAARSLPLGWLLASDSENPGLLPPVEILAWKFEITVPVCKALLAEWHPYLTMEQGGDLEQAASNPPQNASNLHQNARLVEERRVEESRGRVEEEKRNTLSGKDALGSEFEAIWAKYPVKAGKPKAMDAYRKARRNGTTAEEVAAGLDRYVRYVEHRQRTDFRDLKFANGSTWFNQLRWSDECAIPERCDNRVNQI